MHENNPELQAAVQERISLGYSDEHIHAELRDAGYDDETIDRVIETVRLQTPAPAVPMATRALISPSTLLGNIYELCRTEYAVFLSGLRDIIIVWVLAAILFFVGFLASDIDPETIAALGADALQQSVGLMVLLFGLVLLAGVASRLITFTLQRTLQLRQQTHATYFSNLQWSFRHVIAILWLGVLVGLATQFAYYLLIIPGIALTMYALFANYILAADDTRGIAAIVASLELVYGRWWAVFGRVLLIAVVSILVSFGLAVLPATGLFLLAESYPIIAISGLIFVFVAAMWIGFSLALAGYVLLFESLRSTRSFTLTTKVTRTLRTLLIIAAILGFVLSIITNGAAEDGPLSELQSKRTEQAELAFALLNTEFVDLKTQSIVYYNQSGKSYEGVCSELVSTMSYGEKADCADRSDRWALAAQTPDGEVFCIESEQPGVATGGVQAADVTCQQDLQSVETVRAGERRALKDRAQELREQPE